MKSSSRGMKSLPSVLPRPGHLLSYPTERLFCYEVSFLICVDIKSAAFFQCVTLKKGSRSDVNTHQETDLITEKSFSQKLQSLDSLTENQSK